MDTWTPIAREYNALRCGSIDGTDEYPHDKGVLRALHSKYKPNKQVEGDALCTVFVGRLNPETTEDTLNKIFGEYGSIKNLRLVRDIISGFSKRYAFIEYKSGSSARKAASRADKMKIDDREVLVDMECERELKEWIPRRFGGGFGGKKESGQLRFGGKDRPFRKPISLQRIQQSMSTSSVSSTSDRSGYKSSRHRSRSRSPYRTDNVRQSHSESITVKSRDSARRRSRSRSWSPRSRDSRPKKSHKYRKDKSRSPTKKKSKHKSSRQRSRSDERQIKLEKK